jgi:hypothetical protein
MGISVSAASFILSHGYTRGFRSVFLLNASLASVAVVVSIFMIRHKELIRGDEEELKAEAKKGTQTEKHGKVDEGTGRPLEQDLEMGKIEVGNSS